MNADRVDAWLAALEERHLADLTPAEVARALRALSSCYVERRGKLAQGGALESAGKRAAFAFFYAPLHFLVVREILSELSSGEPARDPAAVRSIIDLGCGTGSAGAAWSIAAGDARVTGFDRNPWVVAEANWTYTRLGAPGRARQSDINKVEFVGGAGVGILAAFTVNELAEPTRSRLLIRLLGAHARGARVLIIEPIARRMSGWWDDWAGEFTGRGGRVDQWRFRSNLPDRQRQLGRAAGLDPRQLTARSLWM